MAKYNVAAFTNDQMSTQGGKTSPAFGMGAYEYGGDTVRGRIAHVQFMEQNDGMMPAEDYQVASFLPALWLDHQKEGAPMVMEGGHVVGLAGIQDSNNNVINLVHRVADANSGVPQKLTYTKDDVGVTVNIDASSVDGSSHSYATNVTSDRVSSLVLNSSSTLMVAGNKPLAYTPTHVVGTGLNEIRTNLQFDRPNTMKTQWLCMYPVDDLFMYGGAFAKDAGSTMLVENASGAFSVGETITGGTSTETAVIGSINGDSLYLTAVTGVFTDGETITGGSSTETAEVVDITDVDQDLTAIEVNASTVGVNRSDLGYASVSINGTGDLALEGINAGDKVLPNPYLPGKLISVSDFVRCVMYDKLGNTAGGTLGLNNVVAEWVQGLSGAALIAPVTLADAFAYASEHIVGTCFKRQSRAQFDGKEFVNKDIGTEIMSFLGQVPELGLQGTESDGFEANQESARQLALSGLVGSADVVFIQYNIK